MFNELNMFNEFMPNGLIINIARRHKLIELLDLLN